MNLKIGSALKALAILIGVWLGLGEAQVAQIAGALSVIGAVGWDLYETFRLEKQGVKSTDPKVNAAEEMTPAKLVADEKAAAKL